MRFKLTIVLLLANLAVFFALWRLDRPAPTITKAHGLIDFQPNHITIKDNLQNEVRELVGEPGSAWRLVKPMSWAADKNAVEQLINRLVYPEEMSHFSLEDTGGSTNPLSEYGLDKPRVIATISGPNGKNVVLEVGNSVPSGNNLYVRNPADGEVRVWPQEFFNILETPVQNLRDNTIFSLKYFRLTDLSIRSPKLVKFSTNPQNNDFWQMDTPLQRPVDPLKINPLLNELLQLQAVRFLPPLEANQARQSLDKLSLQVELKTDDSSQTLLIGDAVPNTSGDTQYYAKREDNDAVFTIAPRNPQLLDTLRQAQDKLRERKFLDFTPDKVTDITVKVFDARVFEAELQLRKSESGANPWQILTRDATTKELTYLPADKETVLTLLNDLRLLSAKNFASDTASDLISYGLAQPTWKVTLHMDKTALVLDIGRVATANTPITYYAKVENSDAVYEIDGDIISELNQATDPLHFRERVLERLPPTAQFTSLKLTKLKDDGTDDGEPIFNFPTDPAHSLDDQLKSQTDTVRTNISSLRTWLRSAIVDGYLKASFDEHKPYPLIVGSSPIPISAYWRYRLDTGVQIPAVGQTPAQNQTLVLYFTEQIGASQIGGTHTPESIFTLTFSIVQLLGTLTQNASLPPAAVETLRQQDQVINPRIPSALSPAQAPAPLMPAATP